jgi:hypothetical protein
VKGGDNLFINNRKKLIVATLIIFGLMAVGVATPDGVGGPFPGIFLVK